jgi:protein-S-isoprenylcysteine O-methyltransferase Ste14
VNGMKGVNKDGWGGLELKVPPPVVGLIVAGGMWLVSSQAPSLGFSLPWRIVPAIALGLGAVAFDLAGLVAFGKAKTTFNPIKPETASALVTSGIYGLTRNPMYVALLLALAGWAVYLSHVLALVFLPVYIVYMNRFQILPEERALSAKFGPEYAAYKQSVRRWL